MRSDKILIKELQAIVGDMYVVHEPEDLIVFEYDGSVDKALPLAVVLPGSTEEVSQAVNVARRHEVGVVARGAGTGLSGGAIAHEGGIVIALTRMRRIVEVDVENRLAVVESGLVNIYLTDYVSKYGLYYAPDPSSQKVCTIGGNVAENSGGPTAWPTVSPRTMCWAWKWCWPTARYNGSVARPMRSRVTTFAASS